MFPSSWFFSWSRTIHVNCSPRWSACFCAPPLHLVFLFPPTCSCPWEQTLLPTFPSHLSYFLDMEGSGFFSFKTLPWCQLASLENWFFIHLFQLCVWYMCMCMNEYECGHVCVVAGYGSILCVDPYLPSFWDGVSIYHLLLFPPDRNVHSAVSFSHLLGLHAYMLLCLAFIWVLGIWIQPSGLFSKYFLPWKGPVQGAWRKLCRRVTFWHSLIRGGICGPKQPTLREIPLHVYDGDHLSSLHTPHPFSLLPTIEKPRVFTEGGEEGSEILGQMPSHSDFLKSWNIAVSCIPVFMLIWKISSSFTFFSCVCEWNRGGTHIRDRRGALNTRIFLLLESNHEAMYSVVPSGAGREGLIRVWLKAAAGKKRMTHCVYDPNEFRL